jgi:hypothetical protein
MSDLDRALCITFYRPFMIEVPQDMPLEARGEWRERNFSHSLVHGRESWGSTNIVTAIFY